MGVEDENMDFETFVKRIQRKCPWMPQCLPRRDIRTIAECAHEIGWDKLLNDQGLVVNDSNLLVSSREWSSSDPFDGLLKKYEVWRTKIILNTQFQKSNGLQIL